MTDEQHERERAKTIRSIIRAADALAGSVMSDGHSNAKRCIQCVKLAEAYLDTRGRKVAR
jgi:hypothetical protein